jgi:tripartite-type tricarboxylate transporter receptor subunit TctC
MLRSLGWTILLLAGACLGAEAAGKYPSAPDGIIVPFNVGAATDSLSRLVTEELRRLVHALRGRRPNPAREYT